MDLHSLTAIGRSWVRKVEGVFQEVDNIMKQNKSNHNAKLEEQATSEMVKNLSTEFTQEARFPESFSRSDDQLFDRDETAGTSSISDVEEKPIHAANSPANVEGNSNHTTTSLADDEDRSDEVNNSEACYVNTTGRNNFEQSEVELTVPEKDNSEIESSGPDAVNQLDDLAPADRSERQLEKICEFDTLVRENSQDGEVAGKSQLVTPNPEHPIEGTISGTCQGINGDSTMIVGANAMNAMVSAAFDLKSIPSSAERSSDSSGCLEFLNDDYGTARGQEAGITLASSVNGMEALSILSHDETDHAILSEQSSLTCSEEKSLKLGFERLSNPLLAESASDSSALDKSFSRKISPDILFHAEECDPDSSSLLPYSLSSTTDNSGYDHFSLDMETIDLTDEVEELEGDGDIINSKELYALSLRVQNLRSFKKKLRDAFIPKKRIAKEYEHLGIWYGDIDIKLVKETGLIPSTSAAPILSDSKSLQKHELTESEWVLL
ncbi:uncharacterized protein LOC116215488 isoform X1 [Punica granatum]|uniref:Uncharacterized protein LOC116215488 isoform X1 n=2 Tax=Punica granatum TaxID=22663 RepID=A0A6P8EMG2_PUNGR|nr:uncharacterized protein LOC116215488 isoform X1 [Punica granatum]PKI37693.1 hypothetical protein CRG98_041986 [Punica granatum]